MGKQLSEALDSGGSLAATAKLTPEIATSLVLESMGRDLLVFLTASVVVVPLATTLGVTPILGFLFAGALLGPHGLDVFSNSKADVELGDFGILFLLFSEGLEVTSTRLQRLANFLPLGLAQISLSAATLSAAILTFPELLERFVPNVLDAGLINIRNPSEALVLSFAGTLSTSAFIFPVLKERGWEEEETGQAATSILLLQDLAVAPLLVLLPYLIGAGKTDYTAIAFLTVKATLGFGSVIWLGSQVLKKLFNVIAQTRSTETFVALCLLVSAGMGTLAKLFGLTDTAGAFAAGVLLANTNYRAQIQADILPFKGILLGIFFMDAGSAFDTGLVRDELPTILVGSAALLLVKATTLFGATRVPRWMEPNRLPKKDGIRVSLLLSGGGEFAFVVLALAEKLQVLPSDLSSLLTAIILITMGLTPVLGTLAANLSDVVENDPVSMEDDEDEEVCILDKMEDCAPSNAIVICGYNDMSRQVLEAIYNKYDGDDDNNNNDKTDVVVFDTDPKTPSNVKYYYYFGDGGNPEVLRNHGITNPSAVFVGYDEPAQVVSATTRLRTVFGDDVPIYARGEAEDFLLDATKVVEDNNVERVVELLQVAIQLNDPKVVERLQQVYNSMDQDYSGLVEKTELRNMLTKSNTGTIQNDDEIADVEAWIQQQFSKKDNDDENDNDDDDGNALDFEGFCRLYTIAPPKIQASLDHYLLS